MFEKYLEKFKKKGPVQHHGTDRSKMEITPFRDWRVLVIVFFIALLGVFGFNGSLFLRINTDSFVTGGLPETNIAPLENNKLDNAVKEITKRSEKFEKLRKEKPTYIDPSL